MNDMISVIVPVYKVEKYIDRCINSILAQTYQNLEIILVDDGSPDNCGEICEEYRKKDPRIKVIHKKNGGLSDARNYGLDAATGEYIAFVDSDDYIHPQMYERMKYVLDMEVADLIICNYVYASENQKREPEVHIEKALSDVHYRVYTRQEAQFLYFEVPNKRITFTVAWNKLYKASLFENIRFPVGKIHEDEFTTFKVLYNASKIVYVEESYCYYLVRDNSIMSKFNKSRFDIFDAYLTRMTFYIANDEFLLWKKVLSVYMHMFAKYREWALQSKENCRNELLNYRNKFKNNYLRNKNRTKVNSRQKIECTIFIKYPGIYYRVWKIARLTHRNKYR